MKGFMVFLTLALAASASARVPTKIGQKNIIDDAIALRDCLEKAIVSIETSVGNLVGTVNQIENVIASNVAKFQACLAIGGDNPSIIDQIQEATCILGLVDSIKADINDVVTQVETSVDNLLHATDLISACFPSGEKKVAIKGPKSVIDDALALIQCLEMAVSGVESSVNGLLIVVSNIEVTINQNVQKFKDCLAIGGDNPSIIDQVEQATCILGLVDSIESDVNYVVDLLNISVANLIQSTQNVLNCL